MGKLKYRKAIFIVVYKKVQGKIKYLILKRKLHWKGWEFPKGGIELFERKKKTIKREVKEETGLEIIKIHKFNIKGKYNYDREYSDRKGIIGQTYSLYSAEVREGKVALDKKEHSDFKWISFNKAMKKLTWKTQKESLKIVDKSLKNKNK